MPGFLKSGGRLVRQHKTISATLLTLVIAALVMYGSGGAVSVISTNQVNSAAGRFQYHFEGSSALAASSWLTSWSEYPNPTNINTGAPDASYTSAWNGSSWNAAVPHGIGGLRTGNLFLATNPTDGKYLLTGLLIGGNPFLQLFFQTSTDSSGQAWGPPMLPLPGITVDFPSVAVASNGTIGIGFNTTDGNGNVNGFATIFSSNGGATWSSLATVATGPVFTFGRIVAVGNTFYVFLPGTTPNSGVSPATLQLYQWNGSSWLWSENLATYTAPATNSPGQYPVNAPRGVIGYSPFIDAQATTTGWAVLCPAAYSDKVAVNNFIFCTQARGCSSMNYPTDLFLGGITTSTNGDLWISVLTYSGDPGTVDNPNRTLPLQQVAAYGTSNFNFISGVPNGNIDPTVWAYFTTPAPAAGHCQPNGAFNCFSAGDYMRPAMNSFTGATLPFINDQPPNLFTVLFQSFVQDPQTGLRPVSGLSFKPFATGSDLTYRGVWPPGEAERHQPRSRAVLWPTKN